MKSSVPATWAGKTWRTVFCCVQRKTGDLMSWLRVIKTFHYSKTYVIERSLSLFCGPIIGRQCGRLQLEVVSQDESQAPKC